MPEKNWTIYLSAEEAWEAMLADCERAEVSIDLEQYILNNDAAGRRFLDLFIKKSQAGVKVRLLLDSAGSFAFFNSSIPARLEREGIMVQFFNPISPWRARNIFSWFFRDHRKILVIDSRLGYTGGVGLNYRMNGWRDNHVRIAGPVVSEIRDAYEAMWHHASSGGWDSKKKEAKRSRLAEAKDFSFFTNAPRFGQRFFYHEFLEAIKKSSESVYLSTPYFIPDLGFFRALKRAAKRRVDVRLLLSGISDHPLVNLAASSYFDLALKAGIKVYEFHGKFLHAKSAVVDSWGSLGSTNLDNLSFYFNYEANLVSREPAFVGELKSNFLNDLKTSKEIKLGLWRERPSTQKLLEFLSWPLHKFL